MKDYISCCSFPIINISGIPTPKLILGHLPFIGESYQGPEKNREYRIRFSKLNNIQHILQLAVEKFGATVISTGTLNEDEEITNLHFQAIKETQRATGKELALLPCVQIPLMINSHEPVDVYRRWITYYNIEKRNDPIRLLKKYLEDPILQCRSNWKKKFIDALKKSKPYTSDEIHNLRIDFEKLQKQLDFIKDYTVLFVEVGSESDFLALTGRLDLLLDLTNYIHNEYELKVLAGVHHAGSTIPILEQHSMEFAGYITPINKLGIMMFPNPELALKAIKVCNKPIIAIKPLAGGRIPPKNAFDYVYKDVEVESCMVGVASEREVEEDLTFALKAIHRLN